MHFTFEQIISFHFGPVHSAGKNEKLSDRPASHQVWRDIYNIEPQHAWMDIYAVEYGKLAYGSIRPLDPF